MRQIIQTSTRVLLVVAEKECHLVGLEIFHGVDPIGSLGRSVGLLYSSTFKKIEFSLALRSDVDGVQTKAIRASPLSLADPQGLAWREIERTFCIVSLGNSRIYREIKESFLSPGRPRPRRQYSLAMGATGMRSSNFVGVIRNWRLLSASRETA